MVSRERLINQYRGHKGFIECDNKRYDIRDWKIDERQEVIDAQRMGESVQEILGVMSWKGYAAIANSGIWIAGASITLELYGFSNSNNQRNLRLLGEAIITNSDIISSTTSQQIFFKGNGPLNVISF